MKKIQKSSMNLVKKLFLSKEKPHFRRSAVWWTVQDSNLWPHARQASWGWRPKALIFQGFPPFINRAGATRVPRINLIRLWEEETRLRESNCFPATFLYFPNTFRISFVHLFLKYHTSFVSYQDRIWNPPLQNRDTEFLPACRMCRPKRKTDRWHGLPQWW